MNMDGTDSEIMKKVDKFYNPDFDSGIIWNDRDLLIKWDNDIEPILSPKDLKLDSFKKLKSPFK